MTVGAQRPTERSPAPGTAHCLHTQTRVLRGKRDGTLLWPHSTHWAVSQEGEYTETPITPKPTYLQRCTAAISATTSPSIQSRDGRLSLRLQTNPYPATALPVISDPSWHPVPHGIARQQHKSKTSNGRASHFSVQRSLVERTRAAIADWSFPDLEPSAQRQGRGVPDLKSYSTVKSNGFRVPPCSCPIIWRKVQVQNTSMR